MTPPHNYLAVIKVVGIGGGGVNAVNRMIEAATRRIESGATLPPPDFARYGFEDIDPLGLLTGPNPKLRRR